MNTYTTKNGTILTINLKAANYNLTTWELLVNDAVIMTDTFICNQGVIESNQLKLLGKTVEFILNPNRKLIEFNKESWSDDEPGHLTLSNDCSTFMLPGLSDYVYTAAYSEDNLRVKISGGDSSENFSITGFKIGDLWYFSEFGIEREDENPAVAFGKLLWNIG